MSRRLWSLLDLMQNFPVAGLLDAVDSLGNFVHAVRHNETVLVPKAHHADILRKAECARHICEQHGLDLALTTASKLVDIIRDEATLSQTHPQSGELVGWPLVAWLRLNHHALELGGRVIDSLAARLMLEIPPARAKFIAPTTPLFGDVVDVCFPESAFDIEEAGKCFAVGRYTACVFHLMRAAESAVAVLATRLDATVFNERGETLAWGVLVSNLKGKIDLLPRGSEQDAWLKVHALLHSCNRAYRTKTAHPCEKYTEEEAETAFNATKSFMKEFAELI